MKKPANPPALRPVIAPALARRVRLAAAACNFSDASAYLNAVIECEIRQPVDRRHVRPVDELYIKAMAAEED